MSITARTFTYRDAHSVEIFVRAWEPQDPIAAVHVLHGVGDHSGRYTEFAESLARAGFAVYADDHRGHGETGRMQHGGDLSRLGHLGPGGMQADEAAITQLTGMIRDKHPDLRVGVFAHSWGSFMAQRILQQAPHTWDAVILSGSAYRTPRFLEALRPFNQQWNSAEATGFEWLSSDESVGEAFLDDELSFDASDLPKRFGIADSLRFFGTPKPPLAADVPILIISGDDDPVSKGDGIERLAKAYRDAGVQDVRLHTWPGGRHELFHEREPIKREMQDVVQTWLTDHLTGARL